MPLKLTNNAFATLAASINSSATSITLTTGQGARFPTLSAGDYFYATLVDTSNNLEIVKCTARSTDVLTVVRAQESTTARAYSTGDRIEIRLTAQTFLDAVNEIGPTQVSDEVNSSTGFFDVPSGTTAQRPASPGVGYMRFNTTTGFLEIYDGSDWDSLKTAFVASGGTVVDSNGYRYHTFTTSGSFVVSAGTAAVDILTVAGGGGGGSGGLSGNGGGGGGGAGGYVTTGAYTVTPGTYSVTVGAGGARGTTASTGAASDGGNSVFGSTTTAIGGGGGRNGSAAASGNNGGSGGGGSDGSGGGSGTAGQGTSGGGSSGGAPARGGGGGGGASSGGGTGTTSVGGNGGPGSNWQSLGTFYAGGGGAGCESGYTAGTGGSGGGGNGGAGAGAGQDATANRGSGGGGGGYIGVNGGNGSSGVVIVRYPL